MSRASQLLNFHEEVEKEAVNYMKKGDDWSEVPTDLTLQGTKGFAYNDQACPDSTMGKYYADGKRGAGYGSGNGETKKSSIAPTI